MSGDIEDRGVVKRYLLGELTDQERERFEVLLMSDTELFNEMLLVEEDLVEAYVNRTMSRNERQRFELSYMSTVEGREQVSFARALGKYVKSRAANTAHSTRPGKARQPIFSRASWFSQLAGSPYLRGAAAAVIVIGLGLGIWRALFYQSDVSKGLKALAYAYRDQRPVEARISDFGYAPAANTRGGEDNVDRDTRKRAERIILDAEFEHPSAATYHAVGKLYLADGKFDDAIGWFEKGVAANPNNAQLQSDYGAALMEWANAASQSEARAEYLGKALQHLEAALDLNAGLLEALFNRALCLQAMMAYSRAEAAWTKYLEVDSSSQWAAEATTHLMELHERNKRSGDRETLLEDFVTAFRTGDKEGAWNAYARTRHRTGHFLVNRFVQQFLDASSNGDRQNAEAAIAMLSFAAALEVERAGDHYLQDLVGYWSHSTASQRRAAGRARDFMRSAAERYDSNDFDGASNRFAKAAALYERNGDSGDALFANSWEGFSLVRIPDTNASLAMFGRLSPIFHARGYRWLDALTLNAVADVENSRDNLSRALNYSERSLKLANEIKDPTGVLRNLGQSTSFYLQFGDYQKALSNGFSGLEIARTFPADARQVWPLYFEMASAYLSLDLSSAALEFGKEASRLAIEANFPLMEARSQARLSLIHRARSEYDEAMMHAQRAVDVGQRLQGRGALNANAGATLNLAHLYRLTGNNGAAITRYDEAIALYKQLGLDIYEYDAHKGKLLSLINLGDDAAAAVELPLTMKLYESYRFKIAEESNKNRFFDTGNDLVDTAVDFEYSTKRNWEAAYDYCEASRARSLYDMLRGENIVLEGKGGLDNRIESGTPPLKLEALRPRLPEDVQVLQYAALDDKVICWIVSRNEFEAREGKIAAGTLDQIARDYAGCLAGSVKTSTSEMIAKGKSLYDVLISPVESLLDKNKIICIVPDKALNYVPFAALISPQGRYLIQDFRLQLAPSTSVFLECTETARARQLGTPEKLLSVGDPSFDRQMFPSLPLLSSARLEAEQIGELYSSKKVLVGDDASKEEVRKELAQADVVHFATHYVPDQKSPMLSRLLLARPRAGVGSNAGGENKDDDGCLRPAEIYRMKLARTRLVVLSGCQTGVEQTLRGEGAISVARPFLAAGVPVVVASLWLVETNSTKDLMIAFHGYRKEGLSTVDALRTAQLEMLKKGANKVGPSLTWAAFEVIGGRSEF